MAMKGKAPSPRHPKALSTKQKVSRLVASSSGDQIAGLTLFLMQ